ncbi:transporter [Lentibacillus populi]|uniref:Transporter n=1 Tax=Lentibacillus populi TaxID=1827502 RepID=A0A9W5TZ63_9BACI|nr:DctP family TRAP transporter solute-binding subunit [Lentibacillus populi]GGB48191.1 transporter [Lentibacillus populi]
MKKIALCLVVFTVLIVSGCGNSSEEAGAGGKVEISIGHVGAPVSPQQGAADIFTKLVKEKTGGSVDIKIYNSSQLGDERELVEGIQMGTIDGGIISAGLFASSYNVMEAFEVPFLFEDKEHALKVNNGEIGRGVLDKLESKAGLKALSIWEHGFRQITNSKKPIKKPEDMKGLKIRSPEVPTYSVALKTIGANPIPLSFSELYVALDRGVVNGQHNPLMHIEGQRFYEVQDYMTVMDFAYTPNILALSDNVWKKLSEEQQTALNEAAQETAELWSEEAAEQNEEILKELEGKMDIVQRDEIDREAFKKIVVDKAYPEYEKDYGKEFVQFLEDVQAAAE